MAIEQLSGSIACSSALYGALSGEFLARIFCGSTVAGELRADVVFSGLVECDSSASALLSFLLGLTGDTVSCIATVTGSLQLPVELDGETIVCSATVGTATMQGDIVYLTSHVIRS